MKPFSLAAWFGTACICLSVSPSVLAEESTSLDEIVVTADRKARTVDATLAPVTIITRKDMEKYQASSLPEVLRRVPGISITNSGGAGKATSVSLRGTNDKHVLVLVDGVKIGSATLGSTPFQDIPLADVERIEVVRGPRSSLYGSEAIGGVIQIFTRKGKEGFHPELTLQAGSNDTQAVNASLSGADKATWYSMGIGSERTAGINAKTTDTSGEKDGYERRQVTFRAGHGFANGVKIEANLLQAEGDNEYDPSTDSADQPSNTFEISALSGKLTAPLGQRAIVTAQIGQAKDRFESFTNGIAGSRFDTKRDTASVQSDIQLSANNSLTLGVDHQQDKVDSGDLSSWVAGNQQYTVKSRKNDGVFASYQHQLGKANVEISTRKDDNQQFGKHTTGGVAIGYDINDNLRVKASHGTAFKAPTFNALYYPGSGNPNLKPEKSRNTEVGLSGKAGAFTWDTAIFHNKITDYIEWEEDASGNWSPSNVQPTLKGVEAQLAGKVGEWDITSSVTLQNPKKRSGPFAGSQMVNVPQRILNVDVDRKLGKVSVGAMLHAEDKRYGNAANSDNKRLPGYAILDLRADYQLAKDWTVGAKIGNVLDKDYQTNYGYNQDGINGLVTLKFAPK